MRIKNIEKLTSHGDVLVRDLVLTICEESLIALDSFDLIKKIVGFDGEVLRIGKTEWNLKNKSHVYVIGAGKACNSMARAVEGVLGNRIDDGVVIVKQLEFGDRLGRIKFFQGGHPLPNEVGLKGSKEILELVERATSDDLFIGLISGGSSALMNCPLPGITLEDEIKLTQELLSVGARILETNAVRRHISQTNGGRLVQRIEAKGAEMINLVLWDVVSDRLKPNLEQPTPFYGTPLGPDNTTLENAIEVLNKYDLWLRIPESISRFFRSQKADLETPKKLGGMIHQFVLQTPSTACEIAENVARRQCFPAYVLTTSLEGESREAGIFLASVAKDVAFSGQLLQPPCVLIVGGETTVTLNENQGIGGPNQELALSFALEIAGQPGFCIAAIGTDGSDGPTNTAGGIVDRKTVERATLRGVNIYEQLKKHDSNSVLKTLGDEIITGNTGTNLCDLIVVYVPDLRM